MSFLAIEQPLIDRITATVSVPNLKVLATADLAGVLEKSQPVPAVHVVFGGFVRVSVENRIANLAERWLTVAACRNVRNITSGQDARAEVANILDPLFDALFGWQYTGYRELIPVTPPAAHFSTGFIYVPLAWDAPLKNRYPPCPGINP